jgi:hypothetical protein
MSMVMFMRANGSTTKLMEEEFMNIWTELSTQENGEMIGNMDMALSAGSMTPDMKAIMNLDSSMA